MKVIAGTGEESNENGSGSYSAFGQPMGVCIEGGSIFVTDGQIGTIKLVTNLEGTVEFLQNLGNLYRAFSVHHKHQERESFTLKEAHQMVKSVSSYCNGNIDNVKESYAIASTTNGPQRTIAAKTATSLNLLENGLERLDKNIDALSPGFCIKPEVCLTIQVENVHSVSHPQTPGLHSVGIFQRLWQQHERVAETSNKVVGLLLYESCLVLSDSPDKGTTQGYSND